LGRLASVFGSTLALICCATATVSCSGGGGGGAQTSGTTGGGAASKVTLSFASAAGSLVEGGAASSVQVVLHTAQSATTKVASVNVFDRATGTATSGVDYGAFAPQVVSFPVGSIDGATQTVSITALDDHSVEGASETVKLGLNNATGATAKNITTYTASITDIHSATIHFVAATSATPDESSTERTVSVQLDLASGVTLGVGVSATVQVTGGTATAGTDYATLAPQTIAFPAGSANGSLRNVSINVIDDAVADGDETVVLALSAPSAGAALAAPTSHQLTITDDDSAGGGPSHLVVTEGPTGVENTLASGQVVDLGTQAVLAGPTVGTLVRLANSGGQNMSLGVPHLSGTDANDFAVTLDTASLAAMPSSGPAVGELAPDVPSPLESLPPQVSDGRGIAVAINKARLDSLALLPRATMHGFPVPGMGDVTLELQRLPLPVAAGAVLKVDGVAVAGGLESTLGDLSLWRGSVLEQPGSHVFLALSSDSSRGFIELPFSQDHFVHIVTEGGAQHSIRVMRGADLAASGFVEPPFVCDDAPLASGPDAPPTVETAGMPPAIGSLSVPNCQVAIETDYQLFQKFGSTPALTSYVTQLMAAVSAQYLTDVQTTLSIAYLGVYTTAADPWTSQDSGGTPSALLSEFQSRWSGGHWPVQANLAHFISGASLGGGVSYVNVLCNQTYGFGVSGNISGTINWGSWTNAPGNFTWDFVVVAHEIGHNFGANHTHAYCPPLDQCYTNCTGTTVCSQGTIMSYCHVCGGMDNIDLYFHPVNANIMRQSVNSSCLGEETLTGGNFVQYRVRFNPLTVTGSRSATLEFTHDASNQPTPFQVGLHGTAN
jgi:hypothetical protein